MNPPNSTDLSASLRCSFCFILLYGSFSCASHRQSSLICIASKFQRQDKNPNVCSLPDMKCKLSVSPWGAPGTSWTRPLRSAGTCGPAAAGSAWWCSRWRWGGGWGPAAPPWADAPAGWGAPRASRTRPRKAPARPRVAPGDGRTPSYAWDEQKHITNLIITAGPQSFLFDLCSTVKYYKFYSKLLKECT